MVVLWSLGNKLNIFALQHLAALIVNSCSLQWLWNSMPSKPCRSPKRLLNQVALLLQAGLTDGRQFLFGCVNTTTDPTFVGCQDATISTATFIFQPGERITAMNLWAGGRTTAQPRGGAVNFNTSLVRAYKDIWPALLLCAGRM